MTLTKETEEIVTILPDGQLQYLLVTKIMEDGVELSRNNWRAVYEPDWDLTNLPPRAYQIALAVWNPDLVTSFKQAKEDAYQAELASASVQR
jgi:hypothetical protein